MSWGNEIDILKLENYYSSLTNHQHGLSFRGFDNPDYFLNLACENDFLEAYRRCPPLKSIIGKRSKAFNLGLLGVYNENTNKLLTGNYPLKELILNPNALQSQSQFFAQQNIYTDLFGYCPVLFIRRSGFARSDINSISAMWNIPPWLFDLEYTRKWFMQSKLDGIIKNYYIHWHGKRMEIDARDLKFIFDDGIGTDYDSNLIIPDSRLISLEYPISNIIAAYKSRNTLITKRGAIGILTNEGKDANGLVKLHGNQKEVLQNDFKNYGLVGQPYQIIITEAALKWQQMGFATKDLLLFEEVEDSVNRICEAYQYPTGLMAFAKKSTFNNQNQDRKELYEGIVPESDARLDQFTRAIKEVVELPDNIAVWRDYSHLMIWQEDKKLMAEARMALNGACELEYKNGLITKNQWLVRLGEPEVTDPEFDKYYEEQKQVVPETGGGKDQEKK